MLWISIERKSENSLALQVYQQIKTQILQGKIPSGEKLLSTRELAVQLGISRNRVMEAYDQLLAEGYIESRQGSGTVVAQGATFERIIGHESSAYKDTRRVDAGRDIIDFRSGVPALDLFPKKEWSRQLSQCCMDASTSDFGYCSPEGRMELRTALAEYLYKVRGIEADPERIMITSGATQAASLIARMLYMPGSEIVIEDPANAGLIKVISAPGYTIRPIPVDEHGIRTEGMIRNSSVRFTYLTPPISIPWAVS